jgi:hypothetical protein
MYTHFIQRRFTVPDPLDREKFVADNRARKARWIARQKETKLAALAEAKAIGLAPYGSPPKHIDGADDLIHG